MYIVDYYEKLLEFLSILLKENEKPNVIFVKNKKIFYNKNNIDIDYIDVNAKFLPKIQTIYINFDKHDLENHDEIFSFIHEFRHFYQYKRTKIVNCIADNKSQEEIIKWKENFNNYSGFGNDKFYKQDIEIDANAFTIFIVEKLFKKPCYINPLFDKEKVKECNKIFEDLYSEYNINCILKKLEFNPLDLFETSF